PRPGGLDEDLELPLERLLPDVVGHPLRPDPGAVFETFFGELRVGLDEPTRGVLGGRLTPATFLAVFVPDPGHATLLPLDGGGGFAADVVADPVDPTNLVDDAIGDPRQHLVGEPRPIGGHGILTRDRTNRQRVLVRPAIAHYADALHRQEHTEHLPQLAVETRLADFLDDDGVGFAQHVAPRLGDLAQHPHGQPGPREGMAPDHVFGQPKLETEAPHLVFEQLAQGLDHTDLHALGQATDIVVRLDRRRGALEAHALDD